MPVGYQPKPSHWSLFNHSWTPTNLLAEAHRSSNPEYRYGFQRPRSAVAENVDVAVLVVVTEGTTHLYCFHGLSATFH